jgi:cation transport regulator ChaC
VCTLAPAVPFVLLADEEPSVHGILYHVNPADVEIELEKLFVREQAGYSVLEVMVQCDDGVIRKAFTFTANEENKYWAGPVHTSSNPAADGERYIDDFDAAAETICTAVGPSGSNMEYFMRLYSTLQLHGVVDAYLEKLYAAIEARSK